jgi:hypothetical protein
MICISLETLVSLETLPFATLQASTATLPSAELVAKRVLHQRNQQHSLLQP